MSSSAPALETVTDGIDVRIDEQKKLLQRFKELDTESYLRDVQLQSTRYELDNLRFNTGDAFMLHSMLRALKPKRIVEIGCGMSSCITLDTNERYLQNSIDCTFIDISLQSLLPHLRPGDEERCTLYECPVQHIDTSVFSSLEPGDFLFIDSSHMYQEGSDVHDIIHRILPALQPGVLIHFHDIFWNFLYPDAWKERPWNEGQAVRKLLQQNPEYRIVLFGSHLGKFHEDLLVQTFPNLPKRFGASLWITKEATTKDAVRTVHTIKHPNWVHTPYVVLFTERSGSSYFTTMLSHHPDVRARHEILPVIRNEETLGFERTPEMQSTDAVINALTELYVDADNIVKSAGFKFKVPHQTNVYGEVLELLQHFPVPVRVIKLYRKNLLKQAISCMMHTQRIENKDCVINPQEFQKLTVEPERLIKMLKTLEDAMTELHQLSNMFSMVLPVQYEDLLAAKEETMRSVFSFLRVSTDVTPFSIMQKVTPDSLDACVENMEEMRSILRGTRWEWCLEQ